MAQITRITNKTKFETGDVPTQTDFIDLIDSVFMFQSDTLEDIPQGTNRKWVTPTQINTWDAKENTGHQHAIADTSGLQSALNVKQSFKTPVFLSDTDILGLADIPLNEGFAQFRGNLPNAGCSISIGSVADGFVSDLFVGELINATGSNSNVTVNFKYINTNGGDHVETASGGVITVPDNESLIISGQFVADGVSGFVFVGKIEHKAN